PGPGLTREQRTFVMARNVPNLDLDFVRAQFPPACWEWAFFENAGGSYVPESVIKRLTDYMRECQVQPGGNFPVAAKAMERMNDGHARMAAMIGAAVNEVVITPSTSFSAYVLAQALRPQWQAGDEIVVAVQNHEANSGPWRRLAEYGLKILDWPVHPETGSLDPALLDTLLSERTRLVAFPQVSNILGEINDVAAVTRKVHDAGALVCVDAVAYAPHRAIDVKGWDVDFYLFSFYKIFGPHMGCLYGKEDLLVGAANQGHFFFADDDTAHKLNPAGPQHEMITSLAGIADYIDAVADHHLKSPPNDPWARAGAVFDIFARHEERLATKLVDFLSTKAGVRLIGPATGDRKRRVATFSFTVEGRASAAVPPLAVAGKIGLSNGHFYAKRLVEAVGVADGEDGVVRASLAHYTSPRDVDRLIEVLDAAL
ncbi:MAG: aminotransferase class V-fold PLP-dependent enzyme, partial [Rhodospirillaceae bacterium]